MYSPHSCWDMLARSCNPIEGVVPFLSRPRHSVARFYCDFILVVGLVSRVDKWILSRIYVDLKSRKLCHGFKPEWSTCLQQEWVSYLAGAEYSGESEIQDTEAVDTDIPFSLCIPFPPHQTLNVPIEILSVLQVQPSTEHFSPHNRILWLTLSFSAPLETQKFFTCCEE